MNDAKQRLRAEIVKNKQKLNKLKKQLRKQKSK